MLDTVRWAGPFDPETIGVVVALFERYALGNVSAARLEAATGLAASRVRLNDATLGAVVRALSVPEERPVNIDLERIASRRDIALQFAAGWMSVEAFQQAIAAISVEEPEPEGAGVITSSPRAVAWLRDIAALWNADGVMRETRAVLVAATHAEIVIRGYEVVRVRLTPATLTARSRGDHGPGPEGAIIRAAHARQVRSMRHSGAGGLGTCERPRRRRSCRVPGDVEVIDAGPRAR